jgi:hypothetical protein
MYMYRMSLCQLCNSHKQDMKSRKPHHTSPLRHSEPDPTLTQAAVLLSVCWLNAILTGATFCGPDYNDVAVTAYDTEELRIWKRS